MVREGLFEMMTFEKRPMQMRLRILESAGQKHSRQTPVLRPWREVCLECIRKSKAHVAGADRGSGGAKGDEARETRGK